MRRERHREGKRGKRGHFTQQKAKCYHSFSSGEKFIIFSISSSYSYKTQGHQRQLQFHKSELWLELRKETVSEAQSNKRKGQIK